MKITPKPIILLIASLGILWFTFNFPAGKYLEFGSMAYKLYFSYFNDLAQPFAFYLFLCLFEKWIPPLKTWQGRALAAFALPSLMEIGQQVYYWFFSGHYVGAFDPLDFGVYALGILSAVGVERVMSRLQAGSQE